MTKRLPIIALALLLAAQPVLAQSIVQSGNVTPGHLPVWSANGVLSDAGTASTPNSSRPITSLGVVNNGGPGICVQSAASNYNKLCLSVSTSANAQISLQNFGSASAKALDFVINGVTSTIPTVTTPGVVGDAVCYSTTTGTLADCGVPLASGFMSATQILIGQASGAPQWKTPSGSCTLTAAGVFTCSSSPAGSNTQLQFNNSGSFGASANLTWVSPALTIGVAGSTTGQLKLTGATSGTVTQTGQAAAGTPTITWGTGSGTPAVSVSVPLALSTSTGALTITGAAGQVLAGATPAFTATPTLGASGTLGTIAFGNATSGTITLSPVSGALGSVTLSLPAATDTLVGKATTDTLTNKTLTSPALGGTVTGNNTIPLAILAQSAANTMLGNWTGSTANVLANAMPSCADTGSNHLNYVSGTGVTCGTSSAASSLIVGSTTITSGTTTRILYDNAGTLGEYTLTGTGTVVAMQTSPSLITPALGVATATSVAVGGAAIGGNAVAVTGAVNIAGDTTIGSSNAIFVSGRLKISSGFNGTLNFDNNGSSQYASVSTIGAGTGFQMGNPDTAAPAAQTLRVQSVVAGTAAANGANWTLIGSLPTGTGTSGDIIFQTGVKTGSGTTQGTPTTALTIKGETQTVIHAGPTTLSAALTYGGVALSNAVTGTGNMVLSASPTFTGTPVLNTPTATTLNGNTFTTGTYTLTGAASKVLTFSNTLTFTGTDTSSVAFGTGGTVSYLIASGAKALATGAIASAACTSAQTDTATGAATTDVLDASFASDPTGVTGYIPATTGMLTIIAYATSNTANFKVCNNTASSITPGAISLNWKVRR